MTNEQALAKMTLEQAKQILDKPIFGDPDCIAARERLKEEPEIQRLRSALIGKMIACGVCGGGSGGIGNECNVCDAEGEQVITNEMADSWDLDILRRVAEEVLT